MWIVAFGVSGLIGQAVSGVRKPFNPIIGETYEAYFPDFDIPIYFEQASHHPPISNWQVDGKDWNFTGYAGVYASARGNSLRGKQTGSHKIDFLDGTVITYTHPTVSLSGLIWGARVVDYVDSMVFEDEKNKLKLTLNFNPDQLGYLSSWIWNNPTPTDTIRGKMEMDGQEIGMVEGSWLGSVDFKAKSDGKKTRYWEYKKGTEYEIKKVETPLPSDSRYRKDLIYLLQGEIENSQLWKTILEENQRKEKKWRGSNVN
jgi:hypothetical protein